MRPSPLPCFLQLSPPHSTSCSVLRCAALPRELRARVPSRESAPSRLSPLTPPPQCPHRTAKTRQVDVKTATSFLLGATEAQPIISTMELHCGA